VALALAALACSPGPSAEPEPPPLVVLVSLDTLRADRLELYGYERETAPRLTELAAEATVFETTLAQAAQTLVSHKSMFTGKAPLRLVREVTNAGLEQLRGIAEPHDFLVNSLVAAEGRLATDLSGAGYRTAAFVDGGWMKKGMGFEAGFESFDDSGGGLAGILPRALDWLDAAPTEPAFLFLQTYDVHCPYATREPYDSRFCADHGAHLDLAEACPKSHLHRMQLSEVDRRAVRDHYDGGIASADAWLGELLDHLRHGGRFEEALIIVTSDHGEGLGDHGQYGHGGLYLEQLLVPLVVKFPASWGIEAGRVASPVELVDLYPSLLEACGLAIPDGLDGRSWMPDVLGEGEARRYLAAQTTFREWRAGESETSLTRRALVEPERWLLIHDSAAGTLEAYDLAADPACERDVAAERLDELAELLKVLEARDLGRADAAFRAPESLELSPEALRQLEALGYGGK